MPSLVELLTVYFDKEIGQKDRASFNSGDGTPELCIVQVSVLTVSYTSARKNIFFRILDCIQKNYNSFSTNGEPLKVVQCTHVRQMWQRGRKGSLILSLQTVFFLEFTEGEQKELQHLQFSRYNLANLRTGIRSTLPKSSQCSFQKALFTRATLNL